MKIIDKFLNSLTMYKLTLYYLFALIGLASVLSFLKILPYNGIDILLSTIIAIAACYTANLVFSNIFKAVTNVESVFITALIIVLIFPIKFPLYSVAFVALSLLATGSKYLLTVEKRHLFNPAAIAVLMLALFSPERAATWWIGTPVMFIPVLIGGLLLTRKIRRERMVITFFTAFLVISSVAALLHTGTYSSVILTLQKGLFSSALLFFAFIMLTEPLTSPSTKKMQNIYAVITAFLYATPLLRLPAFVFTPEMALVAGNIFSYVVNPKYRLILPLLEKIKLSPDTYVFVFQKVPRFSFVPGQYMEWTLPHKNPDSRGNRRYFSIASSMNENLMMAVKFHEPPSSYKKELLKLNPGDEIIATSLAGDFVIPKDTTKKLVFIAGGVGVAPFRSILEDIIEKKRNVDIVVFFANRKQEDIYFHKTFERASEFGVKTIFVLTDKETAPQDWSGYVGHINSDEIRKEIPDFDEREFFISGPALMVQNFQDMLLSLGIKHNNIKTDFFPGYSET